VRLFHGHQHQGSDEQRPSAAMFLIYLPETHISEVGI
jgi:hypothetical protein